MRRLPTLPAALVLSLLALLGVACGGEQGGTGPEDVTRRASIGPAGLTVESGSAAPLSLTLTDAGGRSVSPSGPVSWSVADAAVATLSGSGTVVTVAGARAGTTTVRAQVDGTSASSTVTVTPGPVQTVRVTPSPVTLELGETVGLAATLADAYGNVVAGPSPTWASSAPGAATVDGSGTVTGISSPGVATITASAGGRSGSASVEVVRGAVDSVAVDGSATRTVQIGATLTLVLQAFNASGREIRPNAEWSSSDPAVATVAGDVNSGIRVGVVAGVSVGTTTITALVEGVSTSVEVTVTAASVATVTVSPASASLGVGDDLMLTAVTRDAAGNVLPGRSVAWASVDPAVARVSGSGLLTGVAPGTTTVTATSEGVQASVAVTVTTASVATVTVSPASATLGPGDEVTFTAETRDAAGVVLEGRSVAWASSNPSVASVSGSGVVTGVAPGSTTISATSEGVEGQATVQVQVGLSLLHRWDFGGSGRSGLAFSDSEGGARAVIVEGGTGNARALGGAVVLQGGSRDDADWIALAPALVTGRPAVTLEIWATLLSESRDARVFEIGRRADGYLSMTWGGGGAGPRVAFRSPRDEQVVDNAMPAPVVGRQHHFVVTLAEGAGPGGTTVVTWYRDGVQHGSMQVDASLSDVDDDLFLLGRSGSFAEPPTANASYNEVRIHQGVMDAAQVRGSFSSPPGDADIGALRHRWTFSETGPSGATLRDDVGGVDGQLVDAGSDWSLVTGGGVVLRGGPGLSDYVWLGDVRELFEGNRSREDGEVTIELWVTQLARNQWARIFDFGANMTDYLMMSFTRGTTPVHDRVEWRSGDQVHTADQTMAPYDLGVEYHVVMTLEEGGGEGGLTLVRWYKDGEFRGSFETSLVLEDIGRRGFALGRSKFPSDWTASAVYNEVRLHDRALSEGEIRGNTASPPPPVDVRHPDTRVPFAWARISGDGAVANATNLAEAPVTSSRIDGAPVRYEVRFHDLPAIASNFTVQVNAGLSTIPEDLDRAEADCFPIDVRVEATEITVDVRCRDAVTGADRASAFRIVVVGNDVLGGRGFFTYNATPGLDLGPVQSPAPFTWTTGGRNGLPPLIWVGPGEVRHEHDASLEPPFALFVTRRQGGANTACSVIPGRDPQNDAETRCLNDVPDRRNPRHFVLGFEQGRPGTKWGHASVIGAVGEVMEARHPSGAVRSERLGLGMTRVVFENGGGGGEPAILISPRGLSWARCAHIVVVSAPNLVVDVACWRSDGRFTDFPFYIAYLR